MKDRLTRNAQDELTTILNYLDQYRPSAATNALAAIEHGLETIARQPRSGLATTASLLDRSKWYIFGMAPGALGRGHANDTYSASNSPEPPISNGTSFCLGSPSFIGSTVSW